MIQFECSLNKKKFMYKASQTALQVDVIKATFECASS